MVVGAMGAISAADVYSPELSERDPTSSTIATEDVVTDRPEPMLSEEAVTLGKFVLLLWLLKLIGLGTCYGLWRFVSPLVLPRRNVSSGPTDDDTTDDSWWFPSRLFSWTDGGLRSDVELVAGGSAEERLRYKGVLYARIPIGGEDGESSDESP
jgi:hypothetical protein